MCVRVSALSGIYYSGPSSSCQQGITYQFTPHTLQVAVSSTMSHRPFYVPLCQRLNRFEKINLRNIAEAGAQTHDHALQASALATRPCESTTRTQLSLLNYSWQYVTITM